MLKKILSISRSKAEAIESFKEIGFIESEETEDGEVSLVQSQFKWDKLCPLFLSCIPLDRSLFAKSVLMREHQFIMQARKKNWFCCHFPKLRQKECFHQ